MTFSSPQASRRLPFCLGDPPSVFVIEIDGGWFGGYIRPENHRVAPVIVDIKGCASGAA
jgi:hypothetical protein